MYAPIPEIEQKSSRLVGEGIDRMRSGNIHVSPGYDGEYGKIKIFESVERKAIKGQATLF
jgi:PHP family Zn ribbon phosphoesterase